MKTVFTKEGVVVGTGQALLPGVVISHADSDTEHLVPQSTQVELGWFLQPDGSFAKTAPAPAELTPTETVAPTDTTV